MPQHDQIEQNERVVKHDGITAAESFLQGLCGNTFLSLWSYPRIYRDQGKQGVGDGKELCDLLVVFGDHVIIFSDKNCNFPIEKGEEIAWKRWFKRAIENSAKQAWGAERWIRDFSERIFLDKACTQPLPIEFKVTDKTKFHLIVVAHGVSEHVARILGESGSMMIQSDIQGADAHTRPFTIGDLDPSKSFIHVLDDDSLITLMKTRDTVTDFIEYIKKREDLIRNRPYKFFTTGEEQLLGIYLTHINENGEHDFVFPIKEKDKEPDAIFIGPGPWENFIKSDTYKRKIESDQISYMWDGLIEKIGYHALTGTQYRSSPEGIKGTEKVARFMAAEPRHERRALATSWMDMFNRTDPNHRRLRVHLAKKPDEPTYIFLLFPLPKNEKTTEESYRTVRSNYLHAVCMVARMTYPQITHVVAIATESGLEVDRSEDFGYFDGTDWNEEMEKEAKSLQKDLGILVRQVPMHVHVNEYHDPSVQIKHGRNDPCPCGSGKKYKKCCQNKEIYNW